MPLPPHFDAMAKRAAITLAAAERAYHQPAASLSQHLDRARAVRNAAAALAAVHQECAVWFVVALARACTKPKLERVR